MSEKDSSVTTATAIPSPRKPSLDFSDEEKMWPRLGKYETKDDQNMWPHKETRIKKELQMAKQELEGAKADLVAATQHVIQKDLEIQNLNEKLRESSEESASLRRQIAGMKDHQQNLFAWQKSYQDLEKQLQAERVGSEQYIHSLHEENRRLKQWLAQKDSELQMFRTTMKSLGSSLERITRHV
jgi:predicted  nucleic acid-binding Zn-ribbon protein